MPKTPPTRTPVKKAPVKKAPVKKAPVKKPAAVAAKQKNDREIYKVSPLRGMPVEEYIGKKLSGWQAEVTRRLVALVARVAPASTAAIKWSQPIFESNGPFAFIKPARAHLSFGFWRGAELTDKKGILERGDRMGHLKLTSLEELDEDALVPLLREAVRLNQEKGSPTRR